MTYVIPQASQFWLGKTDPTELVQINKVHLGPKTLHLKKWNTLDNLGPMAISEFTDKYEYLGLFPMRGEHWSEHGRGHTSIPITPVLINELSSDKIKLINWLNAHYLAENRQPRIKELWLEKATTGLDLIFIEHMYQQDANSDVQVEHGYMNYLVDTPLSERSQLPLPVILNHFTPLPNKDTRILNAEQDANYLGLGTTNYRSIGSLIQSGYIFYYNNYVRLTSLSYDNLKEFIIHIKNHPIKRNSLLWNWKITMVEDALLKGEFGDRNSQ